MRRRTRPLIGRLPTTGFDTRFTSGIHPARRPRVARVYLAAPAREAGCPGGGGSGSGAAAPAPVRGPLRRCVGCTRTRTGSRGVRVGPARLLRVQVCGAGAELSGLGLFRPACERNGWVSGAGLLGAGSGSCANGTGGAFGAASSSSSCEFAMRSNGRVRRSGDDTVAPLEDDSGRTSVRAYVP
jgi:hypothetical protein